MSTTHTTLNSQDEAIASEVALAQYNDPTDRSWFQEVEINVRLTYWAEDGPIEISSARITPEIAARAKQIYAELIA